MSPNSPTAPTTSPTFPRVHSWAPGEFERLQREHDERLEVIADMLAPLMQAPLAEVMQASLAEFLVADTGKLVFTAKGIAELAEPQAFLLANYVWAAWVDAEKELPCGTRKERIEHTARHSLREAGWADTPALFEAVHRGLATLSSATLPTPARQPRERGED